MKFSRILGVAAAVLMTTAVASQTTTPPKTPASQPAAPAAAPAAPTNADTAPANASVAVPVSATPVVAAPAGPVHPGDAKAGQTKAGACAACHGIDGNSSDPQYPRLAGQHERYIYRQLKLFKSGERATPIMMGMASPLSEQDMRDIGAYFATQKGQAGVADDTVIKEGPNVDKKFYQVGEKLWRAGRPAEGVPACMACHGPTGRGNPGPAYPSLGGQHAPYTVAKLQFFRGGESYGKDANANVIMAQVAKSLSDEDIQSLATYIEGLHSANTATAKAE